jgi:hypothetical protein
LLWKLQLLHTEREGLARVVCAAETNHWILLEFADIPTDADNLLGNSLISLGNTI